MLMLLDFVAAHLFFFRDLLSLVVAHVCDHCTTALSRSLSVSFAQPP